MTKDLPNRSRVESAGGGMTVGGNRGEERRGSSRASSLDERMKLNLAKLQLKLMQQKLQTRERSRNSSRQGSTVGDDFKMRQAMKDREKLLNEIKLAKNKDDVYDEVLYRKADFAQNLISGTLDKELSFDRKNLLNDSFVSGREFSLPPYGRMPPMSHYPSPFSLPLPFSSMPPPPLSYPHHSCTSPGCGHRSTIKQKENKSPDMMEMMMMQNAQMNQTLMQHMLMSTFAAKQQTAQQPSNYSTTPATQVYHVPYTSNFMSPPLSGAATAFINPIGAPLAPANPFKLPSLNAGQMPQSFVHHPSMGPGEFPTPVAAFSVEQ